MQDPPKESGNKRKIVIGTVLFVILTLGIFAYQFDQITDKDVSPTWSDVRWGFALAMLLLLPLEPFALATRIWVLSRALRTEVTFWSCVKADTANTALALLTPSQSGGGFAQVYILARAGMDLSAAFTISILSFLSTLMGLLCMGCYALWFSDLGRLSGTLFLGAVYTVTILSGLIIAGALLPGVFRRVVAPISRSLARLTRRQHRLVPWRAPGSGEDDEPQDHMGPWAVKLIDMVYMYKSDIYRFLRHGKRLFLISVMCTAVFLFSRILMAYLAVRVLGLEADYISVMEIQMALIFVTYFAPTPGGAGVAEGVSLAAMAMYVPTGFAPYYNLIWRFSTVYIAAGVGIYFAVSELIIGARETLRGKR